MTINTHKLYSKKDHKQGEGMQTVNVRLQKSSALVIANLLVQTNLLRKPPRVSRVCIGFPSRFLL